MKLYYIKGACATAIHIILVELAIPHTAIDVPNRDATHPVTVEFHSLNPMGQSPVLVLDDGTVITQMLAIMIYLADLVPEKKLLPPASDLVARAEATRWLAFLAADLHTGFATEFPWTELWDDEATTKKAREFWHGRLYKKLKVIDERLQQMDWLNGEYGVGDAYLFVIMEWKSLAALDLSGYSGIQGFLKRMREKEAVKKTYELEGLEL